MFEGNNVGGWARVTGIVACDIESATCPADVLPGFAGGTVSCFEFGASGMEMPDSSAGNLAFSIDVGRNTGPTL